MAVAAAEYKLCSNGSSGYYIALLSQECGANMRGPGVWVSRSEIQRNLDILSSAPGRDCEDTPSLFGRWGGGA